MTEERFCVAGLELSVSSDLDLDLGEIGRVFRSESDNPIEAEYYVCDSECKIEGNCVFSTEVYSVYENEQFIFRKFADKIGGFILKRDKSIPDKAWIHGVAFELKRQEGSLLRGYLGIEVPFILRRTFILHSSLIKANGYAVAFCGPSGIGKSTQASLWEKHGNAKVLNGDRSCIKITDGGAEGFGSFFAGSSKIYINESAPLKAVVILGQSGENKIKKLTASEAFLNIYPQILNNPWDESFVSALISCVESLIEKVPVYLLECRPDSQAVDLLYNELFHGN